jgi:hypothetical protein
MGYPLKVKRLPYILPIMLWSCHILTLQHEVKRSLTIIKYRVNILMAKSRKKLLAYMYPFTPRTPREDEVLQRNSKEYSPRVPGQEERPNVEEKRSNSFSLKSAASEAPIKSLEVNSFRCHAICSLFFRICFHHPPKGGVVDSKKA